MNMEHLKMHFTFNMRNFHSDESLREGKQYILKWWFIVMSPKLFKRESVVMILFMVQKSSTKLRLVVYPIIYKVLRIQPVVGLGMSEPINSKKHVQTLELVTCRFKIRHRQGYAVLELLLWYLASMDWRVEVIFCSWRCSCRVEESLNHIFYKWNYSSREFTTTLTWKLKAGVVFGTMFSCFVLYLALMP